MTDATSLQRPGRSPTQLQKPSPPLFSMSFAKYAQAARAPHCRPALTAPQLRSMSRGSLRSLLAPTTPSFVRSHHRPQRPRPRHALGPARRAHHWLRRQVCGYRPSAVLYLREWGPYSRAPTCYAQPAQRTSPVPRRLLHLAPAGGQRHGRLGPHGTLLRRLHARRWRPLGARRLAASGLRHHRLHRSTSWRHGTAAAPGWPFYASGARSYGLLLPADPHHQILRVHAQVVPASLWPAYSCKELGGAGWTATIRRVHRSTARVSFDVAQTRDGRPYENELLPLDDLRVTVV